MVAYSRDFPYHSMFMDYLLQASSLLHLFHMALNPLILEKKMSSYPFIILNHLASTITQSIPNIPKNLYFKCLLLILKLCSLI